MYLLFTSMVSLIAPFISFSGMQKTQVAHTLASSQIYSATLNSITVYGNTIQGKEIDYIKIIFILLFAGMLWGLTRVALGLYIIYNLKRISSKEKISDAVVYFNSHIETPFSFFHYIFIPETFRNKEVLSIILKHEQGHIELNHSLDKFYFSLLQSFFWFNPFVYLYHKEMELQHEFEADAFSVTEIETDNYVKNLLETITYNQTPTLLVHQFFHHPLKTRIIMLYKKTKSIFMQKTLIVISSILLLSGTLLIQSQAQNKQNQIPKNVTIMNPDHPGENLTVTLSKSPDSLKDKSSVDRMPQFTGGEGAIQDYFNRNKASLRDDEKPSKSLEIQLVISSAGNVAKVGADPFLDEKIRKDIARVFKSMPLWQPGQKNGKPVPVITYVNVSY